MIKTCILTCCKQSVINLIYVINFHHNIYFCFIEMDVTSGFKHILNLSVKTGPLWLYTLNPSIDFSSEIDFINIIIYQLHHNQLKSNKGVSLQSLSWGGNAERRGWIWCFGHILNNDTRSTTSKNLLVFITMPLRIGVLCL